jgi:TonB family protein
MRYLYIIILGLAGWAGQPARAQAPVAALLPDSGRYQVAVDNRRVSSATDSAGTCTEVLHWGEPSGLVRAFYPSGRLKEYVPYGDLAGGVQHGVASSWFDNGRLSAQQPYYQGQRTGTLVLYYASGTLKRMTEYVAGNEMLGRCFDEAGRPVAYFPYEQLPLYPGGAAQLSHELTKALRLPRRLPPAVFFEPRLVDIAFQVAEDGSIQAPRVARSSRLPELDQAVLAAFAHLARRFIPARRDGRLVRCEYHLPVEFKRPAAFQAGSRL